MNKISYDEMFDIVFERDPFLLDEKISKVGVDAIDPDKRSLLINAVLEDADSVIYCIISKCLDLDFSDCDGLAALHHAAIKGRADYVERLLSSGASIDIKDNWGNTPLWRAVFNKRYKCVDALLSGGANVSSINNHGVSISDLMPMEDFDESKLEFNLS